MAPEPPAHAGEPRYRAAARQGHADPDEPTSIHVGVDDRAMRKGCSYGVVVVDLDRHRIVALLPNRTAATLAGWLKQRLGINVVARDRSSEDARGRARKT